MGYHLSIDMLLLTNKLNLKHYALYETKGLLTITKMFITIIYILIVIISMVTAIAIIMTIINITNTIITISIIIALIIIYLMFVKNINFTFQKQLSGRVSKYIHLK